jgi:hypothetical protein
MIVSAQDLVDLSSKLSDEADAHYKKADAMYLANLARHKGKNFFELAIAKDKNLLNNLPDMRRELEDAIEKIHDADDLQRIAMHMDENLIISCSYKVRQFWIRYLEGRKETFDRAASYARGIDPETGLSLEEVGLVTEEE